MKCPICHGPAIPAGKADFNKTCEDHKAGPVFPPTNHIEISYVRCMGCGFVWSSTMCHKPPQWFKDCIYNGDYVKADPDYVSVRPAFNAEWLSREFDAAKGFITHLDYGGGEGLLSRIMRARGFASQSWDPFAGHCDGGGFVDHKFDLITAFEVFEHAPDPVVLRDDILRFAKGDTTIIFSTLTSDHVGRIWHPAEWWYCAPRNGHVSLYTKLALKTLFHPLPIKHMGEGMHLVRIGATFPSGIFATLQ